MTKPRPQAEFVVYRTKMGAELDWMHKSKWDKLGKELHDYFSDPVLITTSVRDAMNLTMLANQQNELENK